ncbi:unnamed protein product [Linum trigynum]|uniref:Gnk2-homologous domain-containing protein n=1 Tax=Linum trigynum TaxID=586398 RepID=A0AAV2GEX4_9ROSI
MASLLITRLPLFLLLSLMMMIIPIPAEAGGKKCGTPQGRPICGGGEFSYTNTQDALLSSFRVYLGCRPADKLSEPITVYGHSWCRDIDTGNNCPSCLSDAIHAIEGQCPNRAGAQYATEDCCVRYETYDFCSS